MQFEIELVAPVLRFPSPAAGRHSSRRLRRCPSGPAATSNTGEGRGPSGRQRADLGATGALPRRQRWHREAQIGTRRNGTSTRHRVWLPRGVCHEPPRPVSPFPSICNFHGPTSTGFDDCPAAHKEIPKTSLEVDPGPALFPDHALDGPRAPAPFRFPSTDPDEHVGGARVGPFVFFPTRTNIFCDAPPTSVNPRSKIGPSENQCLASAKCARCSSWPNFARWQPLPNPCPSLAALLHVTLFFFAWARPNRASVLAVVYDERLPEWLRRKTIRSLGRRCSPQPIQGHAPATRKRTCLIRPPFDRP